MKLLFSDDFKSNQLNDAFWNVREGNRWPNRELQAYTSRSKNLRINDECLIIEGHHEEYMDRQYTSARIDTEGKFAFHHGLVEVVAKIPTAVGSWPAIWLLPTDIHQKGWPRCGEIDILEHCGYNLDYLFFSIHTFSNNHLRKNESTTKKYFPNVHEGFHKYGFLWEKDRLVWLLDDQIVFEVNRPSDANEENWPFDKEYFLIINMAIGGSFCQGIVHEQDFPCQFQISSVRVFGE